MGARATIDSVGIEVPGSLFFYYFNKGHTDESFYYTGALSVLYALTKVLGMEIHTLIPRFINSFFVAFIAIIAWRFGLLLGLSSTAAQLAGYVSGCWPLLQFVSATVVRDTVFCFFLLLSIYLFVAFFQKRRNIQVSRILLFACSVIIVCLLRDGFGAIYLFLFTAIFFIWYRNRINKQNYLIRICSVFVLLNIVILVGGVTSSLLQKQFYNLVAEVPEQYSSYVNRRGGYSEKGIGSSIFRLSPIIGFPARLAYASLSPVPIPTTFLTYNIRWTGTIAWFLCLPILLKTLLHSVISRGKKYIPVKALAVSFLTYYVAINIMTFTEGHQIIYFPFGILLIIYGIENDKMGLRSSVAVMLPLGFMLTFFYIGIKLST